MTSEAEIRLPAVWIDGETLDRALCHATVRGLDQHIVYRFPLGCKVIVDAGARLLSLIHQQVEANYKITLDFGSERNGALGYLNRAGFFGLLTPEVRVLPQRPDVDAAAILRGNNRNLVEFRAISPFDRFAAYGIPEALSASLARATHGRPDHKTLNDAAYTIFAELIDNIYEHSESTLDGFAALQVYPAAGKARVVVSDSGLGLLDTLGPALTVQAPDLVGQPDHEVIRSLFVRGISRHGSHRGLGIQRCASLALRCRATVHLRLSGCNLTFEPLPDTGDAYRAFNAPYPQHVPLRGTHFCVNIPLA